MKKRWLSAILAIIMMWTMAPMAFAVENTDGWYDELVQSEAYKNYGTPPWDGATYGDYAYSLLDIDQNGLPELILRAYNQDQLGTAWPWFTVFTYDAAQEHVVFVGDLYPYNDISYSASEKAIAYPPTKPNVYGYGTQFVVLAQQEIQSLFYLGCWSDGQGNDIYHRTDALGSGEEEIISKSEYDHYHGGLVDIPFTSISEYKPAVEQDIPSSGETEEVQIYQEDYINQHIGYYNERYDTDVLPMESLRDLQYVLDDIEHDLSTAIYKGLSVATATSETVNNFINLSSYIEISTENTKFSFKVPDEVITDIGHSEYEAIIYQLMASDLVYNGILETFSIEYSDSVREFTKEIAKRVETLAKPEIQSNETKINDLQAQMNAIAATMGAADASSSEFAQAVEQFETLAEEQLDVSKTKSFLNNLTGASSAGLTFVGQILGGINSIGEAYQYACWAKSYAKTSSAFKTVLSALRDAAYARAWGISGSGPAGDEGTLIAYSDANMYMGLYQAIDSFVETMEAYQEDTHREFVRQVTDAAAGDAAEIIVDTMQDVVLDKLGSAICPQLEALNTVSTSGKLLVDLFTGIDDEYKLALAVQSLNHISTLLTDISHAYGRDLVNLNKMDSYIDLSGAIAEEKPVTVSMKFDAAVLFCKSIQMYQNSIMLACEYGMKYIESKSLTNETSTVLTFLAKQKLVTSEIKCHDSALDVIVFGDVSKSSYYSDAINWAVNKRIASGTSDSTFSPDTACTRAQAVTFLWRASGSPEVGNVNNPFIDVPEDSYYHDAVLWAVDEEITSGTSSNTFSPDEQCTRGQIVTMMYRDAGSPDVQAGIGNFRDVEQNAFYAPAVNWTVCESITSGTAEDRFSPNDACTRAQILTFLYRDRY